MGGPLVPRRCPGNLGAGQVHAWVEGSTQNVFPRYRTLGLRRARNGFSPHPFSSIDSLNGMTAPNHWSEIPPAAAELTVSSGSGRSCPNLGRRIALSILCLLLLSGLLVIALNVTEETGVLGLLAGLTLALIPVVIVLPAILWLDRFEAEPVPQLLFAFGWGAVVATAAALLVNTYSLALLASSAKSVNVTAVLVAPWVEEGLKGLAVVAVYLWRREEFDGIVDGIVYAGLAGLGFAFTENVFYLGKAFQDSGSSGLAVTFVLRAIFGPFAHPLFSMAIGVGLGISVGARQGWLRICAPIAGTAIAVLLHAAWNFSAIAGLRGFIWAYLLFQLPIFIGAVAFALWARRRESRLIDRNLRPYIANGWFTTDEGRMLASTKLRSEARSWAATANGAAGLAAMRSFQRSATELAFARDRSTRAKLSSNQAVVEATLLYEASAARLGFIQSPN